MRHRSTIAHRPPHSSSARARHRFRLRDLLRTDPARPLLGVVVTVGVTALVLAVPVVSAKVTNPPPAAMDSTAATPRGLPGSPVVMGEDGAPFAASASGEMGTGSGAPAAAAATAAASSGPGHEAGASAPPDRAGGTVSAARSASRRTASARTYDRPDAAVPSNPAVGRSSDGGAPGAGGTASTSPTASTGGAGGSSGSSSPGSPDPLAVPPVEMPEDVAAQVLGLVNDRRARLSCDSLVADPALAATAAERSAARRDQDSLGRQPVRGWALHQRAVLIARGSSDPAAVVAGWLADPTDDAALLDCRRTAAGLGIASGAGGPWWTLLLR